jgi:serine/threonine protein kinase
MAAVGDLLGGKYRLERLLGEGGMATVFAAENTWTGRQVAIKTILPSMLRVEGVLDRFRIEARAASQVRHPNVIDVLDLGVDPDTGLPFIVQEFLDGETLQTWLDRLGDRCFTPVEAVTLMLPIIDALAAAHAQSVVHRDLKPSNVFIVRGAEGQLVPKVIDFGISKLLDADDRVTFQTKTGMQLGTPGYMSPEQARGDGEIDGRTDEWAAGVLLYELIARRLPHEAETNNLLIAKIIYEQPTPLVTYAPDAPERLVGIIHRALAHRHQDRWPTMAMFAEALRGWLATQDLARAQQPASLPRTLVEHSDASNRPAGARSSGMPSEEVSVSPRSQDDAANAGAPALDRPSALATRPSYLIDSTAIAHSTQIAWAESLAPSIQTSATPRRPAVWIAGLVTATLVIGAAAVSLSRPSTAGSRAIAVPALPSRESSPRPAVAAPIAPSAPPVGSGIDRPVHGATPPAVAAIPSAVAATRRNATQPGPRVQPRMAPPRPPANSRVRVPAPPAAALPATAPPSPRPVVPRRPSALTVDDQYE